ncbi:GGDEF domain-containing protein [Porphyrobacter sp. TH134]|uniref:putative bifunctional diguanylate cyclase/phosphodiesterase n=1 Tax=Porphyrobacter sp. TH134 TaxID=2067450 RepID=UPI000C7DDAAD|nr:EAL domain-containing protein [Porphyrobacter sp. TH134]PLK24677.1 GGDEF domain-containing protein [Porphyrobacter sp. TH134]
MASAIGNAARAAMARLAGLQFGALSTRIALLYAGLFALVLGLIVSLAVGGLARFGEASASRDLAANARVFDEILAARARQMGDQADVLAHDFGFREAVATADAATIASALTSLEDRVRSDMAFVVTLEGELLAADASGVPAPDTLWARLDEGGKRGIIRTDRGLALAAASPIEAPDLIGWLVIAQPLDRAELDRLVDLAPIALEAQVVEAARQPAWLRNAKADAVFERQENERLLYHVSNLAVLQDGIAPRLVLRHALEKSLSAYTELKVWLVLLAAGGIMLVLGLSWKVARSVTEPLQQLDEATRLIGEGREVSLNIATDDEIGRLAGSFNQMVAAIEERERQIIHVGLHDGLTGLPNRKLFTEQLANTLSRRRAGEQVMVAYIDLDDFKMVNDTLGHPAGDTLLRMVAGHLCEDLPDALIARLGGDEFAILIDGIGDKASLGNIADALQRSFERPLSINGQHAACGASIGIAMAPGDGEDGTTLMKNADLALYRAKHEGKSTYHFFEPSLDEAARQRRQLELDLRAAIKEGGFELNFQPLYSLAEKRLTGFEALIRWNHPTRGRVNPAEFIALAEETGLIIPIGEWVLREACHQASTWPDNVTVAVNVSPKQFTATGIVSTVLSALSSSGIAPARLELEITESIFIADIETTLATLHSLRNLGVKIALDDFGTGYSSLSYLRSFPFDKVKIDKSFVEDLGTSSSGHAMIRAITTLANALGMATLAEGVEDVAQFEVLEREGCQNIQGYLFSRPVPAGAVAAMLRDGAGYQRLLSA